MIPAAVIYKNKFVIGLIALVIVYLLIVPPMLKKDNKNPFNLNQFKVEKDKLTISSTEAAKIASDMYNEMKGVNLTINSNFWLSVLRKVITKDDALLVSQAFGVKDGQNLYQWINSEMTLKGHIDLHRNLIDLFKLS